MADGFEISTQTVAAASNALAGPAGDLRQKVTAIQATITGGNPWGGDEQGSIFGGLYTEVLSKAIEALSSHADMLDYAQQNLAEWAQTHDATDQGVTARFGGGA